MFKIQNKYFPKLFIVQSGPSECSDFAILVSAVLFYFVYTPTVYNLQINSYGVHVYYCISYYVYMWNIVLVDNKTWSQTEDGVYDNSVHMILCVMHI